MNPIRIQRQRTKGWRMPPNTVVVSRGTRWGNPFRIGQFGKTYTANVAVSDHRLWLTYAAGAATAGEPPTCEEIVTALKGKNLACWCALNKPCHADTLLRIANGVNECATA